MSRADAQVAGPADSLPQLIDALTGQLLAINAGEGGRLASLTSASLPALRAYLSGMWLYRRGQYKAAGTDFARAVALDSSFALAALGLMQASVWYGEFGLYNAAGKKAWAHREKLSPRDRAMLVAQLGPKYPRPSSSAEMIASAARYRDLAPDRADAWFNLADQLFHFGWLAGIAAAHPQSENALRQAIAIDSTYAPALEHLVLLAARRGDTAATRRYANLYLQADSAGESAAGVRWRLAVAVGDSATADSIAGMRVPLPPTSNSIISWMGLEDGVRVGQSHALLKSIGEREVREGQYGSYMMLHDAALMLGRPDEAREFLRHYEREVGPVPREYLKDALTADGSSASADTASSMLRRQLTQPRPAAGPQLGGWTGTQCLAPLWEAFGHGDVTAARGALPRLRDVARDTLPIAEYASVCALLVDGVIAVTERAPDVRVRVARADSAMKTGPANATQEFGNVVVSRLLESIGDKQGALSAIRRRSFFIGRKPAYGTMLRTEARLAAELGDTPAAVAAYRQYLALRETVEPSLAAEVEHVRAELKRLERASGG
jgi:tetratricopeptide (TPR) repeat protein